MQCRESKHLEITRGDPRKTDSASFTRFVLPFAYRLLPANKKAIDQLKTGLFYETVKPIENDRQLYFTHETRQVLFERTLWLSVNDKNGWDQTTWAKEGCHVNIRGRKIRIFMLPPRIALFEWDVHKPKRKNDTILQTGFLLTDIYFPEITEENRPTLDDLLFINDLLRYFSCPYEEHAEKYDAALRDVIIEVNAEQKIDAKRIGTAVTLVEKYFDRWQNLLSIPVKINGDCFQLVPEFSPRYNAANKPDSNASQDLPDHIVYADNRAYVWTAAILSEGVKSLQWAFRTNDQYAHQFGHWIRLLNVDAPDDEFSSKTHNSVTTFEKKWAKERTYHRWEEGGTWYGFSYHSGAMLTRIDKPDDPPFCRHFSGIYFDMTLLLFYLRISIFRFSMRLSRIMTDDAGDDKWTKEFTNLREQFSRFTILYQYPLLSNQQQGIEMYDLARNHFDINEFYDEVKREIDDTHEFLELKISRRVETLATWIAVIGFAITVMGVTIGLFSMQDMRILDHFKNPEGSSLNWALFLQGFIAAVTGLLAGVAIHIIWKKRMR